MAPVVVRPNLSSLLSLVILGAILVSSAESRRFQLVNNCRFTVWPATLHNADSFALGVTGFELRSGQRQTLNVPDRWKGRMWGRTGCSQQGNNFRCDTGDCGGLVCAGRGGAPPTTLAEFTLNGDQNQDFFDVSNVDGFDIPIRIKPRQGCRVSECTANINNICPAELSVYNASGRKVACKSACTHFNNDEYCCRGAHDQPHTCKASGYAKIFSDACPKAYSYAYDDVHGTFTCVGGDYTITFCP